MFGMPVRIAVQGGLAYLQGAFKEAIVIEEASFQLELVVLTWGVASYQLEKLLTFLQAYPFKEEAFLKGIRIPLSLQVSQEVQVSFQEAWEDLLIRCHEPLQNYLKVLKMDCFTLFLFLFLFILSTPLITHFLVKNSQQKEVSLMEFLFYLLPTFNNH